MIDNPISETRYKEINTALGWILRAKDLMNRAEQCGVDVTGDRAFFEAAEENFNNWKSQFHPTKP